MRAEELFTTIQRCTTCGWESADLATVGRWPYCAQCLAKEHLRDVETIKRLTDALARIEAMNTRLVTEKHEAEHGHP